MSTAHLALNYRPQGVTGDPLRVARPGLKSLNYISRCSRGGLVKFGLVGRSSTNYFQRPTP